ncbi:MAG TPA: hypothetical protein OIM45_04945 [Clostridiaceae bacterium]|nr:hypothetical protein [Clostridiaceae bacterium]
MIEVNDYVRTKNGVIDKVDALYGMIKNTVHLENQKWFDTKNIVNHSKQLIDLIEVGDYVNGKLIHKIDKGTNYCYLYYGNCKTFVNYQIKSIVTHEQFSSIEYKVEEDK